MSKGVIAGLVAAGLAAVTVLVVFLMYLSCSNGEIRLRNQVTAQQKANETSFDTCWKIISQQAQVSEQYKDAFKEIYPALMEGRYGDARGGALMSWITESNPTFDTKLFEKVSNSIEEQRTVFKRDQHKLIDIKREHDNALTTAPSSWFIGGRQPVQIAIITSARTTESFKSGAEEDVAVFQKPK